MPKIKNKEYLQFKDGHIELITEDQFKEWLEGIATKKLPRKCTLAQARALFITLFITGRRPSEIADLKGKDIKKVKLDATYCYQLDIKTLKNGKQVPVSVPVNDFTKEMFEYISNRPGEMYAFWAFRKENPNRVKWSNTKDILLKKELIDGTSTITKEPFIENKSKTYIRKGGLINYYSVLWTGRPAYWFRHHRYSSMYAQGASDSEVQLFKGAKDPKSLEPYKHMSKKMAKSILKSLKF